MCMDVWIGEAAELKNSGAVRLSLSAFVIRSFSLSRAHSRVSNHCSDSAGTLFRGNTLPSKVLSVYSMLVAKEYLSKTIAGPISYVTQSNLQWEVCVCVWCLLQQQSLVRAS